MYKILKLCCVLILYFLSITTALALTVKDTYFHNAFFEPNSYLLDSSQLEKLAKFVETIKNSRPEVFVVSGYADKSELNALQLSKSRALSAKHQLISLGIAPSRIYVESKGAESAVNDSSYLDRRVEIGYIGLPSNGPKTDFIFMSDWLYGNQRDDFHPLVFLEQIKNNRLRDKFIHKLILASTFNQDDVLLQKLIKIFGTKAYQYEDHGLSDIAVFSQVFGTDYAVRSLTQNRSNLDSSDQRIKNHIESAICADMRYESLLPRLDSASKRLFQNSLFMSQYPAETQFNLLKCGVSSGHKEIVTWLLSKGVDVNAKGKIGETALHMAVGSADDISISNLLLAGANPNAQDSAGRTPLHNVNLARQHIYHQPSVDELLKLWNLLIAANADSKILDRGGSAAIKPE
jgi:OmpA family/Ankyrin repeats (3 copies)